MGHGTFDHNKRQNLQLRGSTFLLFAGFCGHLTKELAPQSGEYCTISRRKRTRRILSRLWLSWFSVPNGISWFSLYCLFFEVGRFVIP